MRSTAFATSTSTLLFALTLVSGSLSAQVTDTAAARDSIRFRIPELVVSIPRTTSEMGGAASVTVQLDTLSPTPSPSLEEVLRAMPLVQVRRNSRGQAQPALRGAEDRQIAVLMDGVPLTLGWDHRTDLSIVPLTAARSITLSRGLSSVLLGPNVVAGAVEIRIGSGPHESAPPEPLRFQLGFEVPGAFRTAASAGTRVSLGSSLLDLEAGFGWVDREGWTLAEENSESVFLEGPDGLRLNSDERRVDGYVTGRWAVPDGPWLSWTTSVSDVERGVPPETHVEDPRLWRYPEDFRTVTAISAGTGFHDIAPGRGDVEASFGYNTGNQRIDAFGSADFDDVVEQEFGEDHTFTARLLSDLFIDGGPHLRAGATWADVRHDESFDDGPVTSYHQRLWSVGLEAELRELFDASTRVGVGLAMDGADTPETGGRPPLGSLQDWAGRIGASHLIGSSLRLHASVSRRARFPALRELYSGALGRFLPNPDLRPEVLRSAEAGATLDRGDTQLQVVGFHQRLDDGVVRVSVSTPEGPKFQRQNRDEIRATGLELLASTRFGPVAATGDLTLQRVRGFDENDAESELEYEPAWYGRLGAAVPAFLESEAVAEVVFTADQKCQNPEVGGLEEFSSDPRLDLELRRGFAADMGAGLSRVQASVGVSNVGDARVLDQCGLPQPGRALSIQLRVW